MLRLATALVLVVLALSPASGQTPKRGGILHAMQAEDLPAGFSIHETATIMGLWPVMPCYSNLVRSIPSSRGRRRRRSFPSWPRSGRGRTATAISSSSSARNKCGSIRNSTDYCNPEVDRLIDLQSQELDPKKRLALVLDIQHRLEADVAKPMLGWRNAYFARWPT
jgi:ABC-type transport system substrate-binding protein